MRGDGPTAVKSRLGYLLSGPLSVPQSIETTNLVSTFLYHLFRRSATYTVAPCVMCDLERFPKIGSHISVISFVTVLKLYIIYIFKSPQWTLDPTEAH